MEKLIRPLHNKEKTLKSRTSKRSVGSVHTFTTKSLFGEVTSFFPVMTAAKTSDNSKLKGRDEVYMCLVEQI